MSQLDIYVEEMKKAKEKYNRVDYGQHYCWTCGKETEHKITYTPFRTVYTCTVCLEKG